MTVDKQINDVWSLKMQENNNSAVHQNLVISVVYVFVSGPVSLVASLWVRVCAPRVGY